MFALFKTPLCGIYHTTKSSVCPFVVDSKEYTTIDINDWKWWQDCYLLSTEYLLTLIDKIGYKQIRIMNSNVLEKFKYFIFGLCHK